MTHTVQTMTHPAVVCRRVTKDFGAGENQVRVLRGVDLEVPFGELSLLPADFALVVRRRPRGCVASVAFVAVVGVFAEGVLFACVPLL